MKTLVITLSLATFVATIGLAQTEAPKVEKVSTLR